MAVSLELTSKVEELERHWRDYVPPRPRVIFHKAEERRAEESSQRKSVLSYYHEQATQLGDMLESIYTEKAERERLKRVYQSRKFLKPKSTSRARKDRRKYPGFVEGVRLSWNRARAYFKPVDIEEPENKEVNQLLYANLAFSR